MNAKIEAIDKYLQDRFNWHRLPTPPPKSKELLKKRKEWEKEKEFRNSLSEKSKKELKISPSNYKHRIKAGEFEELQPDTGRVNLLCLKRDKAKQANARRAVLNNTTVETLM